jgi:hypothetical protein
MLLGTTQTVGIQGGKIYNYKVRAQNIHGWGPFSEPFGIKAAEIPEVMIAVTTSIDPTAGDVRISWNEPHDGY